MTLSTADRPVSALLPQSLCSPLNLNTQTNSVILSQHLFSPTSPSTPRSLYCLRFHPSTILLLKTSFHIPYLFFLSPSSRIFLPQCSPDPLHSCPKIIKDLQPQPSHTQKHSPSLKGKKKSFILDPNVSDCSTECRFRLPQLASSNKETVS